MENNKQENGGGERENDTELVRRLSLVIKPLAYTFKFGSYTFEDMVQEGFRCAFEVIHLYDEEKGTLEAFMRRHIKNRFINMRRDHLERRQTPCDSCKWWVAGECSLYSYIDDCKRWVGWVRRNESKRALAGGGGGMAETALDREKVDGVLSLLNEKMPIEYRGDFLKMMEGVRLTNERKEALIAIIKEIVGAPQNGGDDQD